MIWKKIKRKELNFHNYYRMNKKKRVKVKLTNDYIYITFLIQKFIKFNYLIL